MAGLFCSTAFSNAEDWVRVERVVQNASLLPKGYSASTVAQVPSYHLKSSIIDEPNASCCC